MKSYWRLEIDLKFCDVQDGIVSVGDPIFVHHYGMLLAVRVVAIRGTWVQVGRSPNKRSSYDYDCVIYYEYEGRTFSCHQSSAYRYLNFSDGLSPSDFVRSGAG